MAFTRRGKLIVVVVAVVVVAVVTVVALALTGKGPDVIKSVGNKVSGSSPEPDPACPLTGAPPAGGSVPQRRMLAIKVENLPEARPQYGLDKADIIYEEPVEGGITRFIVMFQCQDASRVEPVRSARVTDTLVLTEYGSPAFGYADAAGYVQNAVARVETIKDVNWQRVPKAYHHDSSRAAPHDLYTSTKELWKAATDGETPEPRFTYGEEMPPGKSKAAKDVELYFSDYSDVHWKYKGGVWKRYHGADEHVVADGGQVQADNVLIQEVQVKNSKHKDPAGNPVPEVTLTGSGKAWLLRDGRMILGKWTRNGPNVPTHFTTKTGDEFVLKPGVTWVELYPSNRPKPKP